MDPMMLSFCFMDKPDEVQIMHDTICKAFKTSIVREPAWVMKLKGGCIDVFHCIGHLCDIVFHMDNCPGIGRSFARGTDRLRANSEACEEFNSFMRRLEHWGTAMSYDTFMLMSTILVHIFNTQIIKQKCVSMRV